MIGTSNLRKMDQNDGRVLAQFRQRWRFYQLFFGVTLAPPIKKSGSMLIQVIVYASVATIFLTALITWLSSNIRASRNVIEREMAFHIAEAGIDYYRWHLAHDGDDFQDGTAEAGPYVHEYKNAAGERVGEFRLVITPPTNQGTMVTIESTGFVDRNSAVKRVIESKLAIPSFSTFTVIADDKMRFGEVTVIEGPVHSNDGIRFDGLAKNVVTSAKEDYIDNDHSGGKEFGVHTHVDPVDPLPPADVPVREDVFQAGRRFAVPAIDFDGITADLDDLETLAETGGLHFPDSGELGYRIVLKANDTFDLYEVTGVIQGDRRSCQKDSNDPTAEWSTWSISSDNLLDNFPFPENGIIFVEDDLWVEGTIDGARLTLVAAVDQGPGQHRVITINNDLRYTNYDGTDVIGLIAQGDLNVGWVAEDDLRIDAALISQNGRVGRHYYPPPQGRANNCTPYHSLDTITVYGAIATRDRYGFAWTDGTGYQNVKLIYDANLLYGPPPSYPLTGDTYEVISWEEILD